jgi:hypothetical protein
MKLQSIGERDVFGLFKKKEPPQQVSENENIVDKAVGLLNIQLMLCRSQPGFGQGLLREVVRGYLVGFFDCALQKLGHPIDSDEEFAMLLLRGHALLLDWDVGDIRTYVFASMRLQDHPLFAEGQAAGGNDYNDLLTGKSTRAFTLTSYFMES